MTNLAQIFKGLLFYGYVEIHQVRRLVYDNYQTCTFRLTTIVRLVPNGDQSRRAIFSRARFAGLKGTVDTVVNRPYAHDVISVGRPHLEVKRRLFIGQSCALGVQICAFRLFRHHFPNKMAAG